MSGSAVTVVAIRAPPAYAYFIGGMVCATGETKLVTGSSNAERVTASAVGAWDRSMSPAQLNKLCQRNCMPSDSKKLIEKVFSPPSIAYLRICAQPRDRDAIRNCRHKGCSPLG